MVRVDKMVQEQRIHVGIQGSQAAADHGGLTTAEVASFHEFGLGNNPERSWLRGWFDEKKETNRQAMVEHAKAVVKGKLQPNQMMERLGQKFVGEIQERISAGIPPELKAATIRRKGSSTPLIDTGQLRTAVTYKVD
jgi:hypothetical protein